VSNELRLHRLPAPRAQTTQALTQLLELLSHPLGIGPASDHEISPETAAHVVGEAEKTERPWSVPGFVSQGLSAEAQDLCLTRLDLQVELRQPQRHFREETPRIGFLPETDDVIIGIVNQTGSALTSPGEAFLEPQIEHVVQVDVAERGRYQSPLRGSFFAGCEYDVFQGAGLHAVP